MIKLPKHEASLTITHNDHKSNYETVEDYLHWMWRAGGGEGRFIIDTDDWLSEEDYQECIKNNEIWECQWYPLTPVGFNRVFASSFEKLLEKINEYIDD